ncbi:hypothetical protein ScPMuIL_017441 [Solemya velum]
MSTPLTTPRDFQPYRCKSSREVYRPAIQDFSTQSKHPASVTDEEVIFRLSVTGSITPDSYNLENDTTQDFFLPRYSRGSESSRQSALPMATPITLPSPKVAFYAEHDYKHRVRVRAQTRYKLHPLKRARSSYSDSCLMLTSDTRSARREPELKPTDSLRLDVTNRNLPAPMTSREKRMFTNRTPIKRQSPFCSLMKSSKQYTVAGCDEQPRKTYPTWKHKYSKWLTAGLKIQSLKIHDHKTNSAKHNSPGDHTVVHNSQLTDVAVKRDNGELPSVLNGGHIGP